jgi:DNA replication factor GINS
MSYARLYEAWKQEKENHELQPLDREFYSNLSQYVKSQREELQMLDEKTLKARLLSEELERVKKLSSDLIHSRYRKMFNSILNGKTISSDILTSEEEVSYSGISSTWKYVEDVLKDVLRGRIPIVRSLKNMEKPKRILVRFLKAIPAIIGPDMKAYGPFNEEDVASLPAENAEVLLKRGIAIEVVTR